MKIWQKDKSSLAEVEKFTVGNDRELDIHLAPFDVFGSLAHIRMLESVGLLDKNDWQQLDEELKKIYHQVQQGEFILEEGVEDVHSQVEFQLTKQLGDTGKKIHSARPRNDKVRADLTLYVSAE